jgi:hypothetical protein
MRYEDATFAERIEAASYLRKNPAPAGPVTIAKIRQEVEHIRLGAPDAEQAHSREDGLHQWVLRGIGGGAPFPAALAQEAMKTTEIDFPRWCA